MARAMIEATAPDSVGVMAPDMMPMITTAATLAGSWPNRSANMKLSTAGGRAPNRINTRVVSGSRSSP